VFDLIATILAWFYDLIPNYAIAIALLTLSVMVLLTPLTLKGTKSMLAMQRLQPEMKRIQQQYKGDRQKLNEELMKFYQENKINPLGGCLPLLLQMPVFFVLYRVLHQLTRTCTAGLLASGACTTIGNFAPSYLDHSTELWQDLTATDQMLAFGMDLSQSAANQMRDSFVGALPYLILILAVTATSYIQQLQISARNKSGTPINPQQAMLLKILPAFFAFISLTLPAGIVVYFLVSNLYRIAQQAYITRAFYRQDAAKEAAELEAKGKPEPKTESSEPKAPVLPPAAKKAQAQAAKSGKPAPKPAPKGNGSGSPPAPRPKPKSSGMTARPAPRPTSGDASAGTGSESGESPPSPTPPPKKKKR
jgi:YidC/Oxa1 family membrane protein insertase